MSGLVSKQRLMREVWGEAFVSDEVASRQEAFNYLRRAVQEGVSRDVLRNDFVLQPYLDGPELRAILEGD